MKNQKLTAQQLEEKTKEMINNIEERMITIREEDLVSIQPHLEVLMATGDFEAVAKPLNNLFTMAQVHDEQKPFVITPGDEYIDHIKAQIEKDYGVGTPESKIEIEKRTQADLDKVKIVMYDDLWELSYKIETDGFSNQYPDLYTATKNMLDELRIDIECPAFLFHTAEHIIEETRKEIEEKWYETA